MDLREEQRRHSLRQQLKDLHERGIDDAVELWKGEFEAYIAGLYSTIGPEATRELYARCAGAINAKIATNRPALSLVVDNGVA